MFDGPAPRLFALPPGADFPAELVAGLKERMAGTSPEAMARVELYVNTRRMQRRVRDLFARSGALLLPRIRLVTDLGARMPLGDLPPPVPPLRRRLELAQLVERLLTARPELAPRAAIHDLAESLAALMDEMQGEDVPPERLRALDVSDHAEHWGRSLAFIALLENYIAAQPPSGEARQSIAVDRRAAAWSEAPPGHPVIVAGSTGSRGATARLMAAVAALPQGALVLPGFDFDMPAPVWAGLEDALTAEDHPQYRFRALLDRLGAEPGDVRRWHDAQAPNPARGRLVSLALRPAPVTDQWMVEGRAMEDLDAATGDVTLIEAAGPRQEALAIALRLRKAAEDGITAALITPDRELPRQVTAALDRWGILPDDSAGRPLALSPPGRLMRHLATLMAEPPTAEALLTILKHPLTHSGADRGAHLRHTRELELDLRRHGPAFPDGAALRRWGAGREAAARGWADWIAAILDDLPAADASPLAERVAAHRALSEAVARGPSGAGAGELWEAAAGAEAWTLVSELEHEAGHGGAMDARDYAAFFAKLLQGREVRDAPTPHPHIMIWGTLEARVQGADLVILGGLNDGVWPQTPPPDPWLNRRMRLAAGLLLPERQVGLSAHDFQQAACAREVVLSRALRDAEAQTVPSRWINRLGNLMNGLPEQGGRDAWAAMQARGQVWICRARALEAMRPALAAAPRPAPRPPVADRPRRLPVTEITRLIRDPYAVYAKHILRLRPLDSLRPGADARLRGSVMHTIFEEVVRAGLAADRATARAQLLQVAGAVLARDVPWPLARRLWHARIARVAERFLDGEDRRAGTPVLIEKRGGARLDGVDFELTAKPDRIDALPDGRVHIIDYKTGTPPSEKVQRHFDKQLLLEAAMAERGAFAELGPREVARITYVGLGTNPRDVSTEITAGITEATWEELFLLIGQYETRAQGYIARRAPSHAAATGDYDHLARFGEWEMSAPSKPEDVG